MAKVHMCGEIGSATFNAAMASILDNPAATLPEILGGERPNRGCLNLPRRIDVACSSTALASEWACTFEVDAGARVVVDIPIINCDAWRVLRRKRRRVHDTPEAAAAADEAGMVMLAANDHGSDSESDSSEVRVRFEVCCFGFSILFHSSFAL